MFIITQNPLVNPAGFFMQISSQPKKNVASSPGYLYLSKALIKIDNYINLSL
jgi:hypothetical protein